MTPLEIRARAAGVATAVAHPNIALVKYWGKRDERLIVPNSDSLSMTLDVFPTTTFIRLLDRAAGPDVVTMNGVPAEGEQLRRITAFLDLVRDRAGRRDRASIDTRNTGPVGAGLASSAGGFAALALAAATAYRLDLDPTALSRLARRGSGSASRSVFGGFAVWHAGQPDAPDPDLASYAEPLDAVTVDAALVLVLLAAGPKAVSSRDAMRRTVATSPLYPPWISGCAADLAAMRAALARGDLAAVGAIAERSALAMHATMAAATPPVRYLTAVSERVLEAVRRLRADGLPGWSTMDAGPNVKVLCGSSDAPRMARELAKVANCPVVVARSGAGARLLPTQEAP